MSNRRLTFQFSGLQLATLSLAAARVLREERSVLEGSPHRSTREEEAEIGDQRVVVLNG